MHFLNRNSVPAPACITPHDPARQYGNLPPPAKSEIRARLLDMQQNRCAYCERRTGTDPNDGHVEHFRNQANHPGLTTDWNNLYWSCTDTKFCGKHKDDCNMVHGVGRKRAFDVNDIIDPGVDNPDHFMQFISDGSIKPTDSLTEIEQRRYDETMRIFQLKDAAFLVDSRRDAVKPFIGILSDLSAEGPEKVRAYIARELARLNAAPFETAIRHFLQSNQP